MKKIIGAGGGGKGGGSAGFVAKEESDSLRSIAYAQVLDLVSEGEIEGLVNGLNSVYLDDTPVIDDNGNENFKGVQVVTRYGTQAQDVIEGFPSSENEEIVGVLVTNATPIIRTVTDSLIDAIRVTISFPGLTSTNSSTGDIGGSIVQFKIEVNSNGAGYVQKANDTINGKTTSKYQKSYRIELPGTGPHQVRVSRVTVDAVSAAVQDKLYWDSYTEIIDSKLTYPNSAIIASRVDAANFRSIPRRSYYLKLLKIKIPSNYNPLSRVYIGIWDGTFQVAWSDNPAWVLYDLLINARYGAGMAEADVDKWGLYTIAQYCDELIDNGFGTKEPRFTINCYLQQRTEAFTLIRDLCTVFRGISYWQGGLLNITQDAPQDPAFLFNQANVINGEFTYQGTSKKDRYTVALVTWNDPDDFFKQKVEYVPHEEGILRYGINQSEVVAFGCTSRGQAHRVGRWLLYTAQYETEVVNFEAGIDSGKIQLGQIIKVADPMRAGERRGGRVSSATIAAVTVDQDLTLLPGVTYTVFVTLADYSVEERLFTSANYAARVITPGTNFTSAPHAHGMWMISSSDIEAQTFRIISISEKDGRYQISALAHDPDKFAYIEDDLILQERDISSLSLAAPAAPAGLAVTENLYNDGGVVKVKATFSWDTTADAVSYIPTYRKLNGNIVLLGETPSNEVEILNVDEGVYDFFVIAVSILGYKSIKSTIQYEVLGKSIAPDNVEEFSVIPISSTIAQIVWKKASDLDVLNGGSLELKVSSPNAETPSWENAVKVATLPGNATNGQAPLVVGTYWAKFVDSSGNYSATAQSIYTDILESFNLNVIETLNENPAFTGTKTNMSYIADYGGLCLTSTVLIDDVVDFDSLPAVDFAGGVAAEGSYETAYFDQGDIYTSNVVVNIDVQPVDVTDKIDSREALMDDWTDFDGANFDTVNAEVFMATTEDNPAGAPVWTAWKKFMVSSYKFRAIKFLVVAKSLRTNHSIIIKKLQITIDMPDREEWVSGTVSDVAGTVITYQKAFKAAPAISLSIKNLGIDERYAITAETVSGFTIRFFDNVGSGISRTFDYVAKGYGRKVT